VSVVRLLAAACIACVALQVHAHAMLDHAEPRVGSTVEAAPQELRLWFTERLEQAFSTVEVLDAAGKRVDTGGMRIDDKDRMQLRLPLAALPPGAYTVKWRVVSLDSHATEGRFEFRVGH
jgi:methionine-rich copper-binding protein CopC